LGNQVCPEKEGLCKPWVSRIVFLQLRGFGKVWGEIYDTWQKVVAVEGTFGRMGCIIVLIPGALRNCCGWILFLTDFLRSWLILIESGSLASSGCSLSVEIFKYFEEYRERVRNPLCSVW
jgi:hypothetical protein